MLHGPIHRPLEHVRVVVIHPEDEAAVDHDAEVVQPLRDGGIIASQVLALVAQREIVGRERLEPDEEAPESGLCRSFDEVAAQHGINRRRALKQAPHAAHPLEQGCPEALVAEQVIVEEVEMPARQPIDLGERIVDALGVEGAASAKNASL